MRDVTFVDLSVPIQAPLQGELEGELAKALAATITYEDHTESLPIVTRIFGCTPVDLPEGLGWANEMVTLSTHVGTHMDAPWQRLPPAVGRRSKRIDEVPLEDCYGTGSSGTSVAGRPASVSRDLERLPARGFKVACFPARWRARARRGAARRADRALMHPTIERGPMSRIHTRTSAACRSRSG